MQAPPTLTPSPTEPTGTVNTRRSQAVLPRGGQGPDGLPSHEGKLRYEELKPLGQGSFGEIKLAHDNDIDRLVAIKRLKSGLDTGEPLARFMDEIQVVGQLEHPSIPPIHDVGLDERGYFFVMKYIQGDTLEHIIERLKAEDPLYAQRFSYKARAELFLRVLQAIQFAHEKGILHRDLKPENLMVGPYGEVMVMDWGLAKRIGSAEVPGGAGVLGDNQRNSTRMGTVVGTPAYMSPEQARGRLDQMDARSDLYSLAVVFYELLTLDHYLTPKLTQEQMLAGVIVEEPLSATQMHHRYGIPPEFTFFLRKGLNKVPEARFQSAAEMAGQLRSILDGDVPVQCPCTGLKAAGNRWFDFIDAHPIGAIVTTLFVSMSAAYGVASFVGDIVSDFMP